MQPPYASLRDLVDSTRFSRLRKVLAAETSIALILALLVEAFGLKIYPWLIAGLLCNIGLECIVWIGTDGLYNTHWTWFLSGSRFKQMAYLSYASEIYALKALCWVLLKSLSDPGYVLSPNGLSNTLVAIAWIVTNVMDHKMDNFYLLFSLRIAKIVASFFARPLFLGTHWLNTKLILISGLRCGCGPSYSKYTYSPLAADEVRLLLLPRRLPYCAIELEVLTVKLRDAPPYEAISYTWGKSKQTRDIYLNGRTFTTSIAAYEVLQGRSSIWRSRLVWIDYICINQEDLLEKATQVEQMIQIYYQAQRVIVWLGGFAFDCRTKLTFDMIHTLSLRLMEGMSALQVYQGIALHQDTDEWLSFIHLWSHDWFTRLWVLQEAAVAKDVYFCYGGMVFPWRCFNRIADLFKDPDVSPLLNRTVASRKAQCNMSTLGFIEQLRPLLWHNHTVEAMHKLQDAAQVLPIDSTIRKAVNIWMKSSYNRTFRPIIRDGFLPKDNKISPIPLSFAHLLTAFATLNVTDDRDRVYALRGMVNVDVSPSTKPDYVKSVETLYTDLAEEVWMSRYTFGIVGWAGIGWPRRLNLPSFVPDWSSVPRNAVPLTSACFRVEELGLTYNASEGTKSTVKCVPTDFGPSLHFEGIVFDTIHMQGDTLPQLFQLGNDDSLEGRRADSSAQMRWINEVQDLALHAHCYPGEVARIDALWRTLVVDRRAMQHPAPAEMCQEFLRWLELVKKLSTIVPSADEEDRQLTSEERSVMKESLALTWSTHMAGGCSGRRFCITEQGRMGMFLPGTQVGDKICIVYGASTPWTIRHVGKKSVTTRMRGSDQWQGHTGLDHDYHLVGECYVHGVMKGEAIPKGHQPVEIRLL